ncbi:MAG: tsaE [Gammaproteobacteria bacterium]|jgi:tRNA threonylcarbamoyladenosine biosynthesis protein TsaE|nr:tsaE [Gammaproteobacteria bacterium]
MQRIIQDENQWEWLAAVLAKAIMPGFRLYLAGELGAGKTTLVRCFLRQLGVLGVVKSPTYTLVETYTIMNNVGAGTGGCPYTVHHFDLYRLQSAQELHYIGLEDYFSHDAIVIVEWPEKGLDVLPEADIFCTLSYHECGRLIECIAHSSRGHAVLEQLG